MKKGILERLREGLVLGDGGYILELERRGYVQAGPYTPEVAVEHPEALRQLHREFLRAGADVLQALTFYASKEKLGTAGYADQVEAINRAAVRIANEVAGDEALVAGTLCLTWMYDPKDPGSRAVVRRLFDEQIAVQAAEGVDFFIGETFTFLEEARQCLHAIKAAGYPAMITFTLRGPETAEGVPDRRGGAHPGGEGADILGANCGRDPERMLPLVELMREATPGTWPPSRSGSGPGTTSRTSRSSRSSRSPSIPSRSAAPRWATTPTRARALGVNYIGSCCGSVAHHVRAMAEALGRRPPASAKSAEPRPASRHPEEPDPRGDGGAQAQVGRRPALRDRRPQLVAAPMTTDLPRAADVVVVGGGVHGASVAYHLARRGARRVVLVERKFLASGPTGRSSALVRRFYAMDFLTRTANASATTFQHWAERIGGAPGVPSGGGALAGGRRIGRRTCARTSAGPGRSARTSRRSRPRTCRRSSPPWRSTTWRSAPTSRSPATPTPP